MLLCFYLVGKLGSVIANVCVSLNSTCSASTGISPAYVLFGRESTLRLEHAVHAVTDGSV